MYTNVKITGTKSGIVALKHCFISFPIDIFNGKIINASTVFGILRVNENATFVYIVLSQISDI